MAFNCGESPDALAERWSEYDLRSLGVLQSHESPIEERLDFWMPQLVAASINPWRKKDAPSVDPKDLMPDWWKTREKPRTNAEWRGLLSNMAAAFRK